MPIKFFKVVSSTQEEAKKLALAGGEPWSVIAAEKQSQGRGKGVSHWHSPEGNLYFSVILPASELDDLQILTILAGFSVAKILKEDYGLEAMIKLPNDVMVNGKKICGILTENIIMGGRAKISVMGIGLNTNSGSFTADLKDKATSIKMELKKKVDNKKILAKIVKELVKQLSSITK